MFRMDYSHGKWNEPEIVPYGPIQVPPPEHLALRATVFEGLKPSGTGTAASTSSDWTSTPSG